VVIASPLRLITGADEHAVDPEDISTMTPFLRLLHDTWQAAAVSESGELTLTFMSEMRVVVPVTEDYERWEFVHSDGRMAIVTPGGEVTTFPQQASNRRSN
jgi:hypothetical protein